MKEIKNDEFELMGCKVDVPLNNADTVAGRVIGYKQNTGLIIILTTDGEIIEGCESQVTLIQN